jgi:hypothetical protein
MTTAEDGSWGTWEEDRRYPSKDGTHLIVVSKRTDYTGRIHWKNERRALSRANRTAKQAARDLDAPVEWVKARVRRPLKGGKEPRLTEGELGYLRELLERESARSA